MNKKQKTENCRTILNAYAIGNPINDSDFKYMVHIFEGHPKWEQKKGIGVAAISVQSTAYGRCFCIIRPDLSSTDVSFVTSINERSKKAVIILACRHAIKETIADLIKNNTAEFCPYTWERLTEKNTHIDYFNDTFPEICEQWLKGYTEKALFADITDHYVTYFNNAELVRDFIQFHNFNSKLQVISQTAYLSLLK